MMGGRSNHPIPLIAGQLFQRPRGSVAVLVLWAMALLAVFAIYIGVGVRQRLDFLARIETRHDLRWIARAGVERAMAGLAAFDDTNQGVAVSQSWSIGSPPGAEFPVGRGFVSVTAAYRPADYLAQAAPDESPLMRFGGEDEQSKLNVNTASRQSLVRLLLTMDIGDADEADEVAAAIVDWRDADDEPDANGAEDAYYRGLDPASECKDAAFESREELLQVRGMTPGLWQQLAPYVTVFGSGSVNINTATRPVLAALGMSESLLKKILEFRCGPDGAWATADDGVFVRVNEIVAQLSRSVSLSSSEASELSAAVSQGQISTRSQFYSFQSVARLPQRQNRCRITCVVEKNGNQLIVRQWRQQYII